METLKHSQCTKSIILQKNENMRLIIKEKNNDNLELAQLAHMWCQKVSKEEDNRNIECVMNRKILTNNVVDFKILNNKIQCRESSLCEKQEELNEHRMKEMKLVTEESSYKSQFITELENLFQEIKQYETINTEYENSLKNREHAEKNKNVKIKNDLEVTESEFVNVTKCTEKSENNDHQRVEELQKLFQNKEKE